MAEGKVPLRGLAYGKFYVKELDCVWGYITVFMVVTRLAIDYL